MSRCRRFFTHAIRDRAAFGGGVSLTMTGRIKVGIWLPFAAGQTVDGRSFAWRARVGWRPVTPLRVVEGDAEDRRPTAFPPHALSRRRLQHGTIGSCAHRAPERRV